jgi:hypothetical protein
VNIPDAGKTTVMGLAKAGGLLRPAKHLLNALSIGAQKGPRIGV